MIVKNESKIITRLLDSVIGIIDHYVICDTGSTDATKEIIQEYFSKKTITGKIVETPFVNFGETRTYALKQCFGETNSDYILLLDADMKIVISPQFDSVVFKQTLTNDSYFITQGSEQLQYKNLRLIKNDGTFFYSGVTHEYIGSSRHFSKDTISMQNIYIYDIGDGGSKHDKFQRDIQLLTEGIKQEPNNERYMFYLANSYKDSGEYEKAIEYYNERIVMKGWSQEIWCSHYYKGICYAKQEYFANAISSWLDGFQYFPGRIESLYQIIHHYRNNRQYRLAYHFYDIAKTYKTDLNNSDALFLEKDIYDYKLDYELTIIGFYVDLKEADMTNHCMQILNVPTIPYSHSQNILSNYKYYSLNINTLHNATWTNMSILTKIGKSIEKNHPYEFHPSTPTICIHNNQLIAVVRYVNYYIDAKGNYKAIDKDGNLTNMGDIITRNICGVFDIVDKQLVLNREFEIKYNDSYDGRYKGTEDIRLTSFKDQLFYTGNKITKDGYGNDLQIHIEYGCLDIATESTNACLLTIDKKNRVEKNWVLFNHNDNQKVIYKWFPLTICSLDSADYHNNNLDICPVNIENTFDMPPVFKDIRGSSNGLVIDDEIWFLTHLVSHESKRRYYHMFVILDSTSLKLKKYTRLFTFNNGRVEYILGLEYISDNNQLVIGYSSMDSNPDYISINKSNIEDLMYTNFA